MDLSVWKKLRERLDYQLRRGKGEVVGRKMKGDYLFRVHGQVKVDTYMWYNADYSAVFTEQRTVGGFCMAGSL